MKQRWVGILVACGIVSGMSVRASASVLFEDISYWLPGGVTQINPSQPPVNALVKIQETVWDDVQGRALLQQQLGFNFIHGANPIPAFPINVYGYSITNMNYGNGAMGAGNGVSGFNIPIAAVGVPYVLFAPNAANSWWDSPAGNSGPGNYEWDIDGDMDGFDGDGLGVLQGQTHNSFYLVVPAGTPHGFINGAWIHTWVGGEIGFGGVQADLVYGTLSGPIPEPATLLVLGLGGALLIRRRAR